MDLYREVRMEAQSRPRVVILGGGYGGVYTALRLQKAVRPGSDRAISDKPG